MSTEANIQIAKKAYADFGRGDLPAILAVLDDNVEWITPGEGCRPPARAAEKRKSRNSFNRGRNMGIYGIRAAGIHRLGRPGRGFAAPTPPPREAPAARSLRMGDDLETSRRQSDQFPRVHRYAAIAGSG